ncbi:unnamed protein product [Symbiodinium microadriaticum]|nr:unnamed protein product [Symbiodinium microadriaticum]
MGTWAATERHCQVTTVASKAKNCDAAAAKSLDTAWTRRGSAPRFQAGATREGQEERSRAVSTPGNWMHYGSSRRDSSGWRRRSGGSHGGGRRGGLVAAGAGAALVGTAWAIQGGVTARAGLGHRVGQNELVEAPHYVFSDKP